MRDGAVLPGRTHGFAQDTLCTRDILARDGTGRVDLNHGLHLRQTDTWERFLRVAASLCRWELEAPAEVLEHLLLAERRSNLHYSRPS